MHNIEPFYRWRELYIASEDRKSPFFRRVYSEFQFETQLYNFYLHPQWDSFGSSTLYLKILFADYEDGFALIEMIGEWNDTLHNDIGVLKRKVVEPLFDKGISKFVFFCENVLNFHAAFDSDYYEEWAEEMRDAGGWAAVLNLRQHVEEEMAGARLQFFLNFGGELNGVKWQVQRPQLVFEQVEALIFRQPRRLKF